MSVSAASIPANMIEKMNPADRKALGLKTRAEIIGGIEDKSEKQIQRDCENLLRSRGYWPRTPGYLDGGAGGSVKQSGWYVHIYDTKRNPILLDLLIIAINTGRYLEAELKTPTGAASDWQLAIIQAGGPVVLCRSFAEFESALTKWENEGVKL